MIRITEKTAQALSGLKIGKFGVSEDPERMAWVVLILRKLKDEPHVFPRGKHLTILEIERQLEHAAIETAKKCTVIQGATEEGA
jgi:hypothetical protein